VSKCALGERGPDRVADSTADPRIPTALERDTIAESIFEIRFETKLPDVGELLPGMVYPHLKKDYPTLTRLPIGELPKAVRKQQANLAYTALQRLQGDRRSVSLGDQVISLSVIRPYPGWEGFRDLIEEVVRAAKATDLISSVTRVALRYSNIVQLGPNAYDLSPLDVRLELNIRAEITRNGCTSIVQVGSNATASVEGKDPLVGVLLDVDTQQPGPFSDFWSEYPSIVDNIHRTEKEIFFGLLRDESIKELGPRWPN
jgi:uncharacterized protein (TIGR04255 family)